MTQQSTREALELTQARYRKSLERDIKGDPKHPSKARRNLTAQLAAVFAEYLEDWSASLGRYATHPELQFQRMLDLLGSYTMAARIVTSVCRCLSMQDIDHNGKPTRTLQVVARLVAQDLEVEVVSCLLWKKNYATALTLDTSFKAANDSHRRAHLMKLGDELFGLEGWSDLPSVGMVAVLEFQRATGAISRTNLAYGGRHSTVVEYAPAVQRFLAASHAAYERIPTAKLATSFVPVPWTSLVTGGYDPPLVPFLIKPDGLKFADYAEHSFEVPFKAANRLQIVPFGINTRTLGCLTHAFESGNVAGLLPFEPPKELLPWDSKLPFEERQKLFAENQARRYHNRKHFVPRARAASAISSARRYANYGTFYSPVRADFRGRLYYTAERIQPQADDLARALMVFQDARELRRSDQEGCKWFFNHGVSRAGIKGTFAERSAWCFENAELIHATAKDPFETRHWWSSFSDPWQFMAWTQEASALLRDGCVEQRIPIQIDGTQNCYQIVALLLRDPDLAASVNLTPGPPQDLYGKIAADVTRRLRAAKSEHAAHFLSWFPDGQVPRAAVKDPVMSYAMGSQAKGILRQIRKWYHTIRDSITPVQPDKCLLAFRKALMASREELLPQVGQLRQTVSSMLPPETIPRWESPSGFPVKPNYHKTTTKQVKLWDGSKVTYRRMAEMTPEVDYRRHRSALMSHFVASLDASLIHRVASSWAPSESLVAIHDCAASHAVNVGSLALSLRSGLREIFLGNPLQDLVSALGSTSDIPQIGDYDLDLLLEAEYAFS